MVLYICQKLFKLENLIALQSSPLVTILKCHENPVVITNNCYKQNIVKQKIELRNSSTGNLYKVENFHIFHFEYNGQITAVFREVGWLVNLI